MRTFWVSFYSYKGGVGRSMALANVAAQLAEQGRRVVMIDFDLEAPGLDVFSEFGITPGKPGVVEYVYAFWQSGQPGRATDYVAECKPRIYIPGKLWLMPSGAKDHAYNRKRSAINWDELYAQRDGELFFENWKAEIEEVLAPDYVFIDSRTGLTDVGGICTLQFPDLVVLLFALNEQNLEGIAKVANVIRASDTPPQLLPVATPVPNLPTGEQLRRQLVAMRPTEAAERLETEKGPVEERLERASKLLSIEVKQRLRYSALVALREHIVTWIADGGVSQLASDYKKLQEALQTADPGGIDYYLHLAKKALDNFDEEAARDIADQLAAEYPDRFEALLQRAALTRVLGDQNAYETLLRRAIDVNPGAISALDQLEVRLRTQKRLQELPALIKGMLTRPDMLNPAFVPDLKWRLAITLMGIGAYDEAKSVWAELEKTAVENDPIKKLAVLYNLSEAERRSGAMVSGDRWTNIVQLYEREEKLRTVQAPDIVLNRMQAMHIPYAMLGRKARAVALLEECLQLATSRPPRGRIFTSQTYDNVTIEEFRRVTLEMLEAMTRRDELWDGTKLPQSATGHDGSAMQEGQRDRRVSSIDA